MTEYAQGSHSYHPQVMLRDVKFQHMNTQGTSSNTIQTIAAPLGIHNKHSTLKEFSEFFSISVNTAKCVWKGRLT